MNPSLSTPIGIFEAQQLMLSEALTLLRKLSEKQSCADAPEWSSFSTLASRYDCDKRSIRNLLHQMMGAGYAIDERKIGTTWRIRSEQFDAAFNALCTASSTAI